MRVHVRVYISVYMRARVCVSVCVRVFFQYNSIDQAALILASKLFSFEDVIPAIIK